MFKVTLRPRWRNPSRLADLPPDLFAWAALLEPPVAPPPPPRAVSVIIRRFGISPTFAALAALHSGLGGRNHD